MMPRQSRFAHDSPLEEGGFEPSVPRRMATALKSFCRPRDGAHFPGEALFDQEPTVRIRLPPAASRRRTVRLPAISAPMRHPPARRARSGRTGPPDYI
jgi:hypothetical protein